jgi:hypothetical protein
METHRQPEEPPPLSEHRNEVATVGDHDRDDDGSETGSLVVVLAEGTEETEKSGESEETSGDVEVEGEEGTGGRVETSHEVLWKRRRVSIKLAERKKDGNGR